MSTSGERPRIGSNVVCTVQAPANPAAGADWAFNMPAAGSPVAVTATLTTSATVNTRRVALKIIDNGGHVVAQVVSQAGQAAGLVQTYTFAPNITSGGAFAGLVPVQMPLLTLGNNWQISTVTNLLDVADQWSAIVLTFGG